MLVDEALVKEALAAKERCRDLELELGRAKDDFCQALRSLHGAGASLREIATALGLSHQRVHQLVEGSGAGIWARLGRGRRQAAPGAPCFCSFCGTSQFDTRKLVAGPGVWICERCIASAAHAVTGTASSDEEPEGFTLAAPDDHAVRCNFCGRKARRVEHIVTGGSPARAICSGCLDLCNEILDEDFRSGPHPQR
jgi:hypothetical protein